MSLKELIERLKKKNRNLEVYLLLTMLGLILTLIFIIYLLHNNGNLQDSYDLCFKTLKQRACVIN